MVKKRVVYLVVISLFLLLIIASFVSAGFWDWLKNPRITGKAATSGQTNVSISVAGMTAVTILVFNSTLTGANMNPTEYGSNFIFFNVTVTDADGASDINVSSVRASFNKTGETTRSNSTCSYKSGEDTTNSKNFTCSIEMWYWDAPGSWTINVTANDLGNMTYINNVTTVLAYGQLQSIVMAPNSLSWESVSIGATNQTSNNDPTTINNTGNYDVTSGNVQVQGINLYGATGDFINVGNFSSDIATGGAACSGAACTECLGSVLANGTYQGITGSILSAGNLSEGGGVAQEQLYYCLRLAPLGIPSQAYSTNNTNGAAWTVKIV